MVYGLVGGCRLTVEESGQARAEPATIEFGARGSSSHNSTHIVTDEQHRLAMFGCVDGPTQTAEKRRRRRGGQFTGGALHHRSPRPLRRTARVFAPRQCFDDTVAFPAGDPPHTTGSNRR